MSARERGTAAGTAGVVGRTGAAGTTRTAGVGRTRAAGATQARIAAKTTVAAKAAAAAVFLIALLGCSAVQAQDGAPDAAAVERGRAAYEYHCTPCHGPGPGDDGRASLPGTEALQVKYRGELPALLEERTDLTAAVLRVFLRRGSWSMPPFRPTEVTDADIEDIAAYLAETSGVAAGR